MTNEQQVRKALAGLRASGDVFSMRLSEVYRPPTVLQACRVVSEGFHHRDTAWFVVYEDAEDRDLILPYGSFLVLGGN